MIAYKNYYFVFNLILFANSTRSIDFIARKAIINYSETDFFVHSLIHKFPLMENFHA